MITEPNQYDDGMLIKTGGSTTTGEKYSSKLSLSPYLSYYFTPTCNATTSFPFLEKLNVAVEDGTSKFTVHTLLSLQDTSKFYVDASTTEATTLYQLPRGNKVGEMGSSSIAVELICKNWLFECPIQYEVLFDCIPATESGSWEIVSVSPCSGMY